MTIDYRVDDTLIPWLIQEIIQFMKKPDTTYTINEDPVNDLYVWDDGVRFQCNTKDYTFTLTSNVYLTFEENFIRYRTYLTPTNKLELILVATQKKVNKVPDTPDPEASKICWHQPLYPMQPGTINAVIKRYGNSYRKIAEDLILHQIPKYNLQYEKILICDNESESEVYDSLKDHHPNLSVYNGRFSNEDLPKTRTEIQAWIRSQLDPKVLIMRLPSESVLPGNTAIFKWMAEWRKVVVAQEIICIFIVTAKREILVSDLEATIFMHIGPPTIYDKILYQD